MLGRYVLREVLVPYLVGVFLFAALLTFDLLSSLSGVLLSRGVGAREVGLLVLYRLPWTLSLALPLGLVFAVLVGLAGLIRRSELKAAYAAGVPPLALLRPLVLLALAVSLLNLLNLAELRPRSQEAYDGLLGRILYGEGGASGVLRRQVYAPPGLGVYFAEEVYPEPEGNRLRGVRVVDERGRVYSAEEGLWDEEGWRLKGYVVEGEEVRITPLPPYPSRVWVREAMLLAGYAAAHLAVREGLPFPFATQEAPARRVEGEGLAAMWEQRKALKRAQLKAVPAPHKGLGLPLYAQVTSPLRRYLDLVAHQQLRAWLKGERPLSQAEVLERVGAAEAVADLVREAERKSKLHWTLLHLEAKGYEGPGVLVERRGGQGVFLLPELGLSAQVALPKALPLNAEARLRFLEADLPALEARFALV